MLFIISPAKSLNFNFPTAALDLDVSTPRFLKQSETLIKELRGFSSSDISKLMKISDNLSDLNVNRYRNFAMSLDKNSVDSDKPCGSALFVFNGDVYLQMDRKSYSRVELNFAQNNLRILSGLYGVLRPMDLIQPYRLEMGVSIKNAKGRNLYDFWKHDVADYFNDKLKAVKCKTILNLASNEYSNVIDNDLLEGDLLNIIFKKNTNGVYKNIGVFSKRARGLMSNFIIKNQIESLDELRKFNLDGYKFIEEFSDNLNWHFYN
jgi:cytoplasmic iron level regulating protein YaaA (DUF328/UPF0246 family)